MPDLKIKNKTMYDDMNFPDYEFQEFPMAVPVRGGKVQDSPYDERGKRHEVAIVNSQAELDALKGSAPLVAVDPDVVNSSLRVETEDDVRAALYIQADQIGAKIDRRWSIERIEATIKEHLASKQDVI